MKELPEFSDLPLVGSTGERHVWGVFGQADEVGTVNLLGPAQVRQAGKLVRAGKVINLSLPLDYPLALYEMPARSGYRHHIEVDRGGRDDYLDNFAMQGSSQWDSLRHIRFREFGYYGGRQDKDLDEKHQLGIEHWARHGIVGRGILLDVERFMQPRPTPFSVNEKFSIDGGLLEEIARAQKIEFQTGDILLLRTGWLAWHKLQAPATREKMRGTLHPDPGGLRCPGLDATQATAAWLWDHRVAAIAADNPAVEALPVVPKTGFQHRRLIALQGMPLGELWDLDELASECATDGVYEFMLVSAPLYIPGGVGSPANAYAIR
ncbi:MAG TPA: cyclase family protein [Candidatus Binataceae bacterium]|nr:cyclase family protein [Candidatus Binataceae bacterium]